LQNQTRHHPGRPPLRALRYQNYLAHCHTIDLFRKASERAILNAMPVPLLLTTKLDENRGYMSTDVWPKTCGNTNNYDHDRNRCVERLFLNDTLARCGHTLHDYKAFLDHPNVLLQVVNQHQAFFHPKLISLPLGINSKKATLLASALEYLNRMREAGEAATPTRSKLVVVNNSGWNYRQDVNAHFAHVFGEKNSYRLNSLGTPPSVEEKRKPGYSAERDFTLELAATKFVVSPPGLGFDTYRMWQALIMGAIPIVESSPGFDRTYSRLPVLVVHSLMDVTPEMLEAAYPCFLRNADNWSFEHLTQAYWDRLLARALASGNIDHVTFNHPPTNPYCNFLE
jgi:hypothetical protein